MDIENDAAQAAAAAAAAATANAGTDAPPVAPATADTPTDVTAPPAAAAPVEAAQPVLDVYTRLLPPIADLAAQGSYSELVRVAEEADLNVRACFHSNRARRLLSLTNAPSLMATAALHA
jgi:hypothetical protein